MSTISDAGEEEYISPEVFLEDSDFSEKAKAHKIRRSPTKRQFAA